MVRLILGGLLIAHGIVHAALWLPQAVGAPLPEGAPFDTGRSWLISSFSEHGARVVGGTLAAAVAAATAVAGFAYLTDQSWWWAAVAGAGGSLVLIALYWNVWLSVGALIDVAIIAFAMSVATTSGAEA